MPRPRPARPPPRSETRTPPHRPTETPLSRRSERCRSPAAGSPTLPAARSHAPPSVRVRTPLPAPWRSAFPGRQFRLPAHPTQPPPYPSGRNPRDRHVRQRSRPLHTVVTTPSSAFGSGKRLSGVPRLRRRQCTAYRRRALRSPGHTWVAEGNATRTAAQSGGEGTGTRSSAQHGEGRLVGQRQRACMHITSYRSSNRLSGARSAGRVAGSRRGMSLPPADCRRGGGGTAACSTSTDLSSLVPHTCDRAVGTEFHRAPPRRALVLRAEQNWAHPEVLCGQPRGKAARQGLRPRRVRSNDTKKD
jgi:hypothetical protein